MMGTTGFVWFTIVYGRCSAGFEEIYHQTTFRQFTALSLVPTSSCDQLIVDHDQSAYTLGNHATIRLILRKATLDIRSVDISTNKVRSGVNLYVWLK
jgi:hypothetical protein